MESQETSRGAIADQAADWLIRLDAGRGDPDAFEAWRAADPRHAAIFAQVAATWQKTGELRGAGLDMEPSPPSAATPPSSEETTPPHPRITRRFALTGLAAGLASLAVGTGFYLRTMREQAETGVGERRTILLPDGSRIALNTDSRIGWRLGDRLDFWLERGEAALFIVPGTGSPEAGSRAGNAFTAHSDATSGAIEAALTGGHYAMRMMENGLRLIAFSGQARVSGATGTGILLRPGQILVQNGLRLSTQALSPEEIDRATAWQRGEIIFDGMTLAQALNEFNRYLPRPMELADPSLASIQLGGRFNSDDPQGFLEALSDGFGINSRTDEKRISLFR